MRLENSTSLKNQNLISKYRKLTLEPIMETLRDYFEKYRDNLQLDDEIIHEF